MTLQIAVLDDYQDATKIYADWRGLEPRVEVTVFKDHLHDREAVVRRLAPFDVICLMRERTGLDASQLARLPRLKLIVLAATRHSGLDIEFARSRGIEIGGTDAVHTGTPELTWGLILALARQIPQQVASVRNGGWQCAVGRDLTGRTLGVLGLGRIGSRVAQVAKAFDMKVIAWSPNLTAARAEEQGVVYVNRDSFFSESDFLVISMQLRAATRGLVGRKEISLMKASSCLINTSRGGLIDDDALIEALRTGRIAGAALDVFEVEPLPPDHPYRILPNVLATPHIGYVTEDTYRLFHSGMVQAVVDWMDGRPVRVATEHVMGA